MAYCSNRSHRILLATCLSAQAGSIATSPPPRHVPHTHTHTQTRAGAQDPTWSRDISNPYLDAAQTRLRAASSNRTSARHPATAQRVRRPPEAPRPRPCQCHAETAQARAAASPRHQPCPAPPPRQPRPRHPPSRRDRRTPSRRHRRTCPPGPRGRGTTRHTRLSRTRSWGPAPPRRRRRRRTIRSLTSAVARRPGDPTAPPRRAAG